MDIRTNETSLITQLLLTDDAGDPITGVAYDDADLAVSYRLVSGGAWVDLTLVDGTLGTFVASSWKEIGGGLYQLCPPDAAIVANTATAVRVTYGANASQYDVLNARLVPQSLIRVEAERMQGVRDWGVVGDAPLFEPAVSDNGMATWGTPVYDGTTRRLYYSAGDGAGSYVIRHIALDAAGLPTGSPTTVLSGSEVYDTAGAFLPVVEREGSTLHMFYCGMPSAFTNQNICYATASTSDPLTWTKQGVAIAYSDLPAYLHSGAEPTGLIKFGSTYYMYLCSTHGGAAAALGASTMDRRSAVATASSLAGPWALTPLLCESRGESFQEPWIYNISPSAFRASSSSTGLFYLISASGGVNTDYQQLELHESPTPLFSREYTRHIGSILVPRDEGSGFPDWEIDVVGTLTDDIEKDTRSCTSGELWLYFGGKSHSDGIWKMGLSKQVSVVKALRPPIQTRCHRYGTQLPLRPGNLIEPGPLRSGLTPKEGMDLLLAAAIGKAAASGDDETFKFLDDTDAFTTTFDTSNNRISVSLL